MSRPSDEIDTVVEGAVDPNADTDVRPVAAGLAEVRQKRGDVPVPKKKKHRLSRRKPAIANGVVKNDINVTPFIDVVLVLLIIFMVVTPMLSRGVKVELPETTHHQKKQDTGEQIVVSIGADGTAYIDGPDAVPLEQVTTVIKKVLTERRSSGGSADLHVKADRRLTYGEVRKVLEKLHEGGAAAVALGSEEKKKPGSQGGH